MNNNLHKLLLLIAHRGDTLSFPENTVEAFRSAFEKGSNGIELDVHLYNGEVIIVHNYLFDRNSSYPKLKDILEMFASRGRIEIEIKEFNTEILRPLKAVLDNFPKADVELTTSEIPLGIYIKDTFPKIPLGLIYHDFLFQDWMTNEIVEQKLIGWGKMTKSDRLHISFKMLGKFGKGSLVEKIHKAGFMVHSHIFNTDQQKNDLSALSEWNVDQCTFDSTELFTKI